MNENYESYAVFSHYDEDFLADVFRTPRKAVRFARKFARRISKNKYYNFAVVVTVNKSCGNGNYNFDEPLYKLLINNGKVLD